MLLRRLGLQQWTWKSSVGVAWPPITLAVQFRGRNMVTTTGLQMRRWRWRNWLQSWWTRVGWLGVMDTCRKNITCFICGVVGHKHLECRTREEQAGSQSPDTEQAPSVCTVYMDQARRTATTTMSWSQVLRFNRSSNQALAKAEPVWIRRRKVMASVDN